MGYAVIINVIGTKRKSPNRAATLSGQTINQIGKLLLVIKASISRNVGT